MIHFRVGPKERALRPTPQGFFPYHLGSDQEFGSKVEEHIRRVLGYCLSHSMDDYFWVTEEIVLDIIRLMLTEGALPPEMVTITYYPEDPNRDPIEIPLDTHGGFGVWPKGLGDLHSDVLSRMIKTRISKQQEEECPF